MKKLLVRRLGVGSIAKFVGIAHAIWGFVVGVFLAFSGVAAVIGEDRWSDLERVFASLAVVLGALVVFPIVAFVAGWLYGAVFTLIANLILHTSDGIELDVEEGK